MFDALLTVLEKELQAALDTAVKGLVATARTRLEGAVADVAEERAKGLAEVAKERAKGLAEVVEERAESLAEVDARKEELGREIAAMQKHKEAQEGRVKLNIGGYCFETSVQTLRRISHTFFDAYFSGRYAQDVCNDGSIFVDRDGEHFGHVLEYMRDGVVAVAAPNARPDVSLLRALKREFGFYCIELLVGPEPESALVFGGCGVHGRLKSMERYDVFLERWSTGAAMGTERTYFGTCVLNTGDVYVTGGVDNNVGRLSSAEMYSPSSDTWTPVASMPQARSRHVAVAIDQTIYVLGGVRVGGFTASTIMFDTTKGTWNEVAPMPGVCDSPTACAV
jgi:hypothetical protein